MRTFWQLLLLDAPRIKVFLTLGKSLIEYWKTGKSMTCASSLTVFELRMLEVARALSTKPRLLLDDVMAGLNPVETASMIKIIRELRDRSIRLTTSTIPLSASTTTKSPSLFATGL